MDAPAVARVGKWSIGFGRAPLATGTTRDRERGRRKHGARLRDVWCTDLWLRPSARAGQSVSMGLRGAHRTSIAEGGRAHSIADLGLTRSAAIGAAFRFGNRA